MSDTAVAEEVALQPNVYRIPAGNLSVLTEIIEKLNAKAKRYGTGAILLSVLTHTDLVDEETGEVHRTYHVSVVGDTPVVGPYVLVACLTALADGVLVRGVPGAYVPEKYRTADPTHCDHCGLRRQRAETFVVLNTETNEYAQVGRQCLRDYLGGLPPAQAAAQLEYLASAADACASEADAFNGGTGRTEDRWHLIYWLGLVSKAITTFGWVSATKARDNYDLTSTTQHVLNHIFNAGKYGNLATFRRAVNFDTEAEKAWLVVGPEEKAEAEKALAWARAEVEAQGDSASDYWHNISLIVKPEVPTVARRTRGLASSIIAAYRRATSAKVEKEKTAELPPSEYVGVQGEKVALTVSLIGLRRIDGQYGTTVLHRFVTEEGNILVWFASNGAQIGDIGESFDIKGSIKGHEEYNGSRQTALTRVKRVG